jgi:hypothetical protein
VAFTAGQRATATALNLTADPPRFGGLCTAGQTLASGNTYIAINLDTELYDTVDGWSPAAPSRYTVQVAGLYLATAAVGFVANSTGNRSLQIGVNGGSGTVGVRIAGPCAPSNSWFSSITAHLQLSVGDYVECMAWQASGGSLATSSGSTSVPTLSLVRVSA